MDLSDLKEILRILEEQDITEFELEQDGVKLRVCRSSTAPRARGPARRERDAGRAHTGPAGAVAAQPPAEIEADGTVVRSPIVGTFYRSPDPNSPAFVQVGDTSRSGRCSASSKP